MAEILTERCFDSLVEEHKKDRGAETWRRSWTAKLIASHRALSERVTELEGDLLNLAQRNEALDVIAEHLNDKLKQCDGALDEALGEAYGLSPEERRGND